MTVISFAMLLSTGVVEAQPATKRACGTPRANLADYRDLSPSGIATKKLVENAHFMPEVQRSALAGKKKHNPYGNLVYTLERIPNHHQALFMMGVYQFKVSKYDRPYYLALVRQPSFLPASCWFERAIAFRPQDVGIYNAQGRVLHMMGKHKEAIVAFKRIIELAPDSPQGHYNLGLAYYSVGNFKSAAEAARTAQKLGHRRMELIARLKRKGHWKE